MRTLRKQWQGGTWQREERVGPPMNAQPSVCAGKGQSEETRDALAVCPSVLLRPHQAGWSR